MFLYNLLFGRMFPRPYVATLSYIKHQRNVIMTNECRFFFFKGMGGAPFDAIFFITVFTETVKCV